MALVAYLEGKPSVSNLKDTDYIYIDETGNSFLKTSLGNYYPIGKIDSDINSLSGVLSAEDETLGKFKFKMPKMKMPKMKMKLNTKGISRSVSRAGRSVGKLASQHGKNLSKIASGAGKLISKVASGAGQFAEALMSQQQQAEPEQEQEEEQPEEEEQTEDESIQEDQSEEQGDEMMGCQISENKIPYRYSTLSGEWKELTDAELGWAQLLALAPTALNAVGTMSQGSKGKKQSKENYGALLNQATGNNKYGALMNQGANLANQRKQRLAEKRNFKKQKQMQASEMLRNRNQQTNVPKPQTARPVRQARQQLEPILRNQVSQLVSRFSANQPQPPTVVFSAPTPAPIRETQDAIQEAKGKGNNMIIFGAVGIVAIFLLMNNKEGKKDV